MIRHELCQSSWKRKSNEAKSGVVKLSAGKVQGGKLLCSNLFHDGSIFGLRPGEGIRSQTHKDPDQTRKSCSSQIADSESSHHKLDHANKRAMAL